MQFAQITLHYSIAAKAVPCQQLTEGIADVALMSQIRTKTNSSGKTFSVASEGNVRSCTYVRNHINALPSPVEFWSGDVVMVRVIYTCGGGCEELIIASAIFHITHTNHHQ
jgi:hypothetical protein